MNELIESDKVNAIELFNGDKLDPLLASITKEVESHVFDVFTEDGRKGIKSLANKVAKSKTLLDKYGKEYVAELKSLPKKVDSERKRMRDYLDALKEKCRKPLTEWELEQEYIKDEILKRVNDMKLNPLHDSDIEFYQDFHARLTDTKVDDSFGEYVLLAEQTRENTMLKLEAIIARKELAIKEAKELHFQQEQDRMEKLAEEKEQLKREAEERVSRETKEREDKLKQEIEDAKKQQIADDMKREVDAERDRVKAQREAGEALLKAENEARHAAVMAQQEKQQAIEDEQRKARMAAHKIHLAAEVKKQDEIAENERLSLMASDLEHRARINDQVLNYLMHGLGIPDDKAKKIINAISEGVVPYVSINY